MYIVIKKVPLGIGIEKDIQMVKSVVRILCVLLLKYLHISRSQRQYTHQVVI